MKENAYKHNELIVTFKPCELVKECDISIDMGSTDSSISPPYCPPCDTSYKKDSTFLIILIALLISCLNKGGLEF